MPLSDEIYKNVVDLAPELVGYSHAYNVCADGELYNLVDEDEICDLVGGFADLDTADQCVEREARVVVVEAYKVLARNTALVLEMLVEDMGSVDPEDYGFSEVVDIKSLRVIDKLPAGQLITDSLGVAISINKDGVYGTYTVNKEGENTTLCLHAAFK